MGTNSLAGHYLKLQISFFLTRFFFFFLTVTATQQPTHRRQHCRNQQNKEDNTYHHILPLTTTYYHIPTQPNTTKHNTHFQHRYRPTSFQVARGLHRKHQDSCFLHDANMSDRQGMATALALWPLGQVRAVRTQRGDWTSDHYHCY